MTDYVEGKTYRLVATGRLWSSPKSGWGGEAVFRDGNFHYSGAPNAGVMAYLPFERGYEYEVYEVADEPNAIDPEHYRFSGGVQVVDISEHLTANAAQALQYIARSSRIDGKNKGNTIEDLTKAIWFLDRELLRKKEAQ